MPMREWLEIYVLQVTPYAEKHKDNKLWEDYLYKYELMIRERLSICLKNSPRQRRHTKRLFNDLQILIQEANYTDDQLLSKT